jgi:hypothetical protein
MDFFSRSRLSKVWEYEDPFVWDHFGDWFNESVRLDQNGIGRSVDESDYQTKSTYDQATTDEARGSRNIRPQVLNPERKMRTFDLP